MSIASCSEAANILGIFHYPSKSHHIMGATLLEALASKGHQVTMLSPYRLSKPFGNFTELVLQEMLEFKERKFNVKIFF